MPKKIIASVIVCSAGLAACTTPGADIVLSLDENIQAEALRACHADLGIAGPFAPQKIPLDSGQVSVFVTNENGISLAEARSVNRCAGDRLLATYGGDTFSFSARAQEDAINACKKERGVPGNYATEQFQYGSRKIEVRIVPGYAVTEADARAINGCARAKLNGGATGVANASRSTAVPVAESRPVARSTASCPMGASVRRKKKKTRKKKQIKKNKEKAQKRSKDKEKCELKAIKTKKKKDDEDK